MIMTVKRSGMKTTTKSIFCDDRNGRAKKVLKKGAIEKLKQALIDLHRQTMANDLIEIARKHKDIYG